MLAGVPVHDDTVLELARLVGEPDLAGRLEDAYGRKVKLLALTIGSARQSSARSTTRRPASMSCAASCCANMSGDSGKGSRRRKVRSPARSPDSGCRRE